MKARDYVTACANFGESLRLDPALGTLLNLGLCEERLGKLASALSRFRQVVEQADRSDGRMTMAQEHIRQLEPVTPRLQIRTEAAFPADARVQVDGQALMPSQWNGVQWLDAGNHVVTIEQEGREPVRLEVTLWNSERKELTLTIGPPLSPAFAPSSSPSSAPPSASASVAPSAMAPGPPSAPPQASSALPIEAPTPPRSGGALRAAGWAFGGAGLFSIASSLVLGALAQRESNRVYDLCSGNRCTEGGLEANARGRLLTGLGTAALVAGGAAVSVGGVLLLVSPPETAAQSKAGASWAMSYTGRF